MTTPPTAGSSSPPPEPPAQSRDALRIASAGSSQALVLFDGVCALCIGSVTFIIDRDPGARFAFASLQGDVTRDLRATFAIPADLDTICLIEGGRLYTRSTAALRIARHLRAPWPLLYGLVIVPRPLRDWVYGVVAKHRYRWFGRHDVCRMPTPEAAARLLDGA